MDRLSKPIDVLCNGTPFLPYIWAPLKLILQTVQHHMGALDRLVSAYGRIGQALPRLTRLGETFCESDDFQQLLSYLYSDILDFHSRAYRLIQKPGWKIFFSSGWGRFEHHFDGLLQNIIQSSELLDKEAVSLDISQTWEWRRKSLEDARKWEERWDSEQYNRVTRWLEAGDSKLDQEPKLERLRDHCREGTSQWLTKSGPVRSWLQFGRGHPILWLYGKPGSGKSILCSQLIYFLRSDPSRNCLFFFCDFHTTSHSVTSQVLKSLCIQMVDLKPELASFIYDECIATGSKPSITCLKQLTSKLLAAFQDIRIIIDGIDEVDNTRHRDLIKTLASISEAQDNCKLIFSSQDVPSIRVHLKKKPALCMADQSTYVAKDLDIIVSASLEELNDRHDGVIPDQVLAGVKEAILERAQGMFLWVFLVLKILETASSREDLYNRVHSLPKDLADAYNKILTNITRGCSDNDMSKQRRVFSWMLFSKGKQPLRKHELRIAMELHSESSIMNENTKPFPNALDICKPFIEDGPGGSVVFIHSTVPQFLIANSSGPFINELDAHSTISLACLSQLLQSLCFAAESPNLPGHQYSIGQSFHALLPYAVEYWVEHVLTYASSSEPLTCLETSTVMQKLLELCNSHKRLLQMSEKGELPKVSVPDTINLDRRLGCFETFPDVSALLASCISYKQAVKGMNEPPSSTLDPTLFSAIRETYHQGVIHLVTQDDCQDLSKEDLMVFKEEFGPTAYVCHVRDCYRSLIGYSTTAGLKDHEIQHRGLLKCTIAKCPFNDIGFPSYRKLKDHQRNHHPTHSQIKVPRQIRREPPTDPGANGAAAGNRAAATAGGQPQQPLQRPPLIYPMEIRNLSTLSDEEKSKYETDLQGLWNKANNSPKNSLEHIAARQKILEFSKMLITKIQQRRSQQMQMQQNNSEQTTHAQPQQQAVAQQAKIPDHILQHVSKVNFKAPHRVAERDGIRDANKWVEEIKDRYTRALWTMDKSKQVVAQIDKIVNHRAQAGQPFKEDELRQLQLKKDQQLKAHSDAHKYVNSVREQQGRLKSTGQAQPQSQGQTQTAAERAQ
ncbi:NACHT domain-containing protein [Fusarium mundagurra]|uniref:NACHT domain-containing protein n=1 Tax=Fusarium mundagurra TaxID=1567541 RepID=A0A8H5Z553_9HYPO|nr:NACHT domain-containing protein [Fusarium mundagurra]